MSGSMALSVDEAASSLMRDGFLVIPLRQRGMEEGGRGSSSPSELTEVADARLLNSAVLAMTADFPDMQVPSPLPSDFRFSTMLDGKLVNAGADHHPLIRRLRVDAFFTLLPFLERLASQQGLDLSKTGISAIADTLLIRARGTNPTWQETWHRDNMHRDVEPDPTATEAVFGGWINLDAGEHQVFRCVPGSHLREEAPDSSLSNLFKVPNTKNGYFAIKEERVPTERVKNVLVPPAHLLIFFEKMMHAVSRTEWRRYSGKPMARLFTGARLGPLLTVEEMRAESVVMERLRSLAKLPIKGGRCVTLTANGQFARAPQRIAANLELGERLHPLALQRIRSFCDEGGSSPIAPSLEEIRNWEETKTERERGERGRRVLEKLSAYVPYTEEESSIFKCRSLASLTLSETSMDFDQVTAPTAKKVRRE